MRSLLIIGNWKLNGDKNTIISFLSKFNQKLVKYNKCCVAIAPPIVYLDLVSNYLMDSDIKLCAQNVDINLSGAFTGDISAVMLKDLGTQYTLIGHSERRIFHKENDAYIAKKFSVLKSIGIIPVLCIGENKTEYDSGLTKMVCINQVDVIIQSIGVQALKDTVIAYEPIWTIGSGVHALPEQVQLINKSIRDHIAQYDPVVAKEVLLQYGGSINSENVAQFFEQKDVNGVLVGSASLCVDDFVKIIKIAEMYA